MHRDLPLARHGILHGHECQKGPHAAKTIPQNELSILYCVTASTYTVLLKKGDMAAWLIWCYMYVYFTHLKKNAVMVALTCVAVAL